MSTTRPLSRAYLSILAALHEAGGSGELDTHCRVITGPTRHPMPGDANAWLVLVAHGMIAGELGRVIVTDLGRQTAEAVIAGRTTESV